MRDLKQWILILFISAILMAFAQTAFAQPGNYSQSNVSGWLLKGNTISNSGTTWLGTRNLKGLSIRTNSTPAIHVDSSQNVGVGLYPNARMDIKSKSNLQAHHIFRMRDSASSDLFTFRGNGDIFYKNDRVLRLLDTGLYMNMFFGANTASGYSSGVGNTIIGNNIVANGGIGNNNVVIGTGSSVGSGGSLNRGLAVLLAGNNVGNLGMSSVFNTGISYTCGFGASVSQSNIISYGGFSSVYYNSMHLGTGQSVLKDRLKPFTIAITTLLPDATQIDVSVDTAELILKGCEGSGTGIGGNITFKISPASTSSGWYLNPAVRSYSIRGDGGGNMQYRLTSPLTTPSNTYTQYADTVSTDVVPHFLTQNGDVIRLFQQSAINNPSGGATQDTESRAAIAAILNVLRNAGLIEP